MANRRHLEFIKQVLKSGGSAAWNTWRASMHRIHVIYGYMSMVEVDLSGADLTSALSFSHLDLADVSFQKADTEQTNIRFNPDALQAALRLLAGRRLSGELGGIERVQIAFGP